MPGTPPSSAMPSMSHKVSLASMCACKIETRHAVDLIQRIHRVFCASRYVEESHLSPCHAPHWCLPIVHKVTSWIS